MLAESVVISVIVAVLRGKKFRSIENIEINKFWLILLSFSIEFISVLIIKNDIRPLSLFFSKNYLIIQILVYLFLFIFFVYNVKSKTLMIVCFGVFLNFVVIAANNGFMPVSIDTALTNGFTESVAMLSEGKIAGHAVLIKGEANLWLLADIINIPPPYPFPQTISIGDIFMAIGTFLFIQVNMKKK
ncbi:DUF5317 domain-containing protein [Wukongibacter baidiensis]|uniref:DUF5317 domain-containing protein n=1 Tax=Wukongibacter baidiensis TaxID=1723361 RepID=UPI003D7F49EE